MARSVQADASTSSIAAANTAPSSSSQHQQGNGSAPQQQQQQDNGSSYAAPASRSKRTAREVLISYYEAYNAGDLAAIAPLLAEDVSYHDMAIYDEPFVGRQAVLDYLEKVKSTVPSDLNFVIDDASDGDPYRVGVLWHVECGPDRVAFPFSRGASFYTVNDAGQITSARDLVETPNKPGSVALQILAALAPLVRKLGTEADPSTLRRLPLAAAAVWAFYAGYTAYILFSTSAPGLPAYQTPPEVLTEVFNESLNFFYVNIGLEQLGLTPIHAAASPPVSEALFNFMAAWGLLFLPVIMADGPSKKVEKRFAWWTAIMFLTNVFFIPFLALRAAPEPIPAGTPDFIPPPPSPVPPHQPELRRSTLPAPPKPRRPFPPPPPATTALPGWAPVVGVVGLAVGLLSIGWALAARPEYGGLEARAQYFVEQFNTNRVFYAFVVDAVLYSVWQAVMLPNAPAKHRFVPFFGLVAHLFSAQQPSSSIAEKKKQG